MTNNDRKLIDRLRLMARHTLIETIPAGEPAPELGAAWTVELAADILQIKVQKEENYQKTIGDLCELLLEFIPAAFPDGLDARLQELQLRLRRLSLTVAIPAGRG